MAIWMSAIKFKIELIIFPHTEKIKASNEKLVMIETCLIYLKWFYYINRLFQNFHCTKIEIILKEQYNDIECLWSKVYQKQ